MRANQQIFFNNNNNNNLNLSKKFLMPVILRRKSWQERISLALLSRLDAT